MKRILSSLLLIAVPALAQALTPVNNCGRGRHIVKAWVCSDAETGGRYALGAVVICSEKRDSRFSGYTSLLDDNVHTGMKCRPADKN